MQKIITISSLLIIAVLSCIFIIAQEASTISLTEIHHLDSASTDTQANSHARSSRRGGTIWSNISSELNLDHKTHTEQVQREIRRLVSNRKEFTRILNSAAPYIHYIFNQTQARGLPAEIALIPFIESEFNPNDHSNKGALGLWQLMPATARELGVKVNSGYDGRKNLIASTNAALKYFKDLNSNFKGNWYLAIAAYNCGPGNVNIATRRAGSHNFFNLPLPRETRYYVPRLLAVAEIMKNPEKYGIQVPSVRNEPYFKEVSVSSTTSLNKLAQTTGADITDLQKLNPDHKTTVISKQTNEKVLIPQDNAPLAQAKIDTAAAAQAIATAPVAAKPKQHTNALTQHHAAKPKRKIRKRR